MVLGGLRSRRPPQAKAWAILQRRAAPQLLPLLLVVVLGASSLLEAAFMPNLAQVPAEFSRNVPARLVFTQVRWVAAIGATAACAFMHAYARAHTLTAQELRRCVRAQAQQCAPARALTYTRACACACNLPAPQDELATCLQDPGAIRCILRGGANLSAVTRGRVLVRAAGCSVG
jgi:hypothetical protein